jgi:hypothetical protein
VTTCPLSLPHHPAAQGRHTPQDELYQLALTACTGPLEDALQDPARRGARNNQAATSISPTIMTPEPG